MVHDTLLKFQHLSIAPIPHGHHIDWSRPKLLSWSTPLYWGRGPVSPDIPTCYVGRRAFQLTCMLNATAAAITPVVTKLFSLSISTGSFPQAAKSSVLVLVSHATCD